MRYTIVLLSFILVIGCRSTKETQNNAIVPIQYREKIVERLVPVQAPADSANIAALFECDSLNRVIMKNLDEQKSKHTESQFSFNAGVLKYKVTTAPDISFAKVRDSIVYREVPIRVPVEVKVNYLTWWQKLWINIGKGVAGLSVIAVVVALVKSKIF